MSDKLKPCPVPKCGCIPIIRMRHPYKQDENPIFYVLCDKCLFSSEHLKPNGFKSIKSAANWWNTRPDPFKNVREVKFPIVKLEDMPKDTMIKIIKSLQKDMEEHDNADN